jgi:Ni,Fe-hydrogenase III large subunit/Ni,Fe-hydrogenase III component G
MTAPVAEVAAILRLTPEGVRETHPGELVVDVELSDLPRAAADVVTRFGARLLSLFATDERQSTGQFRLHHVWLLPRTETFLRVCADIDPATPSFPSIAAQHPAANWFEREIMDWFGLTPLGHPNPSRVALHDDWPDGAWELRKDFAADRTVPREAGDFHPFRPVTGEGVFQVPVGPVHAGIIEPGHFRFGVAGEPVLYLQVRLFYVHKGTEKRFEQLPWQHGLFLSESISGDTTVGHALAYAHAIERIAAIDVPPRARAIRVLLLELERVYNHISDIGAIATDVAFLVPASQAQILREQLVRLQERLFGTRLLRGTVAIGGVKVDVPPVAVSELRTHLQQLQQAFDGLIVTMIDAGTFTDRVDGTGILTRQAAWDLGVVGMAARASGVDGDLRRDHPHDAYDLVHFKVSVEEGGDVRARLMVRAREVGQSFSIVQQVLDRLPDGPLSAILPDRLPGRADALGWVEAWRGPVVHYVSTDDSGRLNRVKVTDPSFLNWPGLVHAVPGNIIPDFPVINKSFNLSYSGTDR